MRTKCRFRSRGCLASRVPFFTSELVAVIVRLIHLLSLAQHRLLKSADLAFKETLDISTTQLGVLFLLEKRPGALFKDVSDDLGVNASAITALIARMEDAGLVRRQPSDDDQRAIHLFATANGLPNRRRRGRYSPALTPGWRGDSVSERLRRSPDFSTRSCSAFEPCGASSGVDRATLTDASSGIWDRNGRAGFPYFLCLSVCMKAFSSGCR
jgi:DNA-binding MarR family transcriptional regulator